MRIDPEISGASIVFAGDLNPAIFHPAWLFANGVENPVSDDQLKIDVCRKDIAKFDIAETAYFIDQERFQIQTSMAPWIHILDKSRKIFQDLLSHTPIKAVGINRDVHFNVRSNDARTKLGRILAPIEPWGQFGAAMESKKSEHVGGLLSLTMRIVEKSDGVNLVKNIRVEPSGVITGNQGVYMQVNFHFDVGSVGGEDGKAQGASAAIELAINQFEMRSAEAEKIFDQIMGLV